MAIRTADLLTVFQQIDSIFRTCAGCRLYAPNLPRCRNGKPHAGDKHCLLGYSPVDAQDGCDDWLPGRPAGQAIEEVGKVA